MTAYVPQVKHKVRRPQWHASDWVTVLAVGKHHFFGRCQSGSEFAYGIGNPGDWVQVVDLAPLPDRWTNLYEDGSSAPCSSRNIADELAAPGRIAVLHTWTDEHGKDQAKIERVDP